MENLDTLAAVFTALGGNPGVEALTGCKPSTVSMWKAAERFPTNTYLIMTAELQARGCAAPASLWGMKTPVVPEPESADPVSV